MVRNVRRRRRWTRRWGDRKGLKKLKSPPTSTTTKQQNCWLEEKFEPTTEKNERYIVVNYNCLFSVNNGLASRRTPKRVTTLNQKKINKSLDTIACHDYKQNFMSLDTTVCHDTRQKNKKIKNSPFHNGKFRVVGLHRASRRQTKKICR